MPAVYSVVFSLAPGSAGSRAVASALSGSVLLSLESIIVVCSRALTTGCSGSVVIRLWLTLAILSTAIYRTVDGCDLTVVWVVNLCLFMASGCMLWLLACSCV